MAQRSPQRGYRTQPRFRLYIHRTTVAISKMRNISRLRTDEKHPAFQNASRSVGTVQNVTTPTQMVDAAQ